MTDLMNRLTHARPTDAALAAAWPTEEQDALLARIHAAEEPVRGRRPPAWLVAAAAVVVVGVAVPVVGGGDASARGDLLELAAVAASSDGALIAPGTFLHVKQASLQENSRFFDGGSTYEVRREAWIAWDGTEWAVDTYPRRGAREYHHFEVEEASFGTPTPEFVSSLPDEAGDFRRYLDEHVSGSSSHDEALFTAVTDMAWSHMLTPDRFAVALEAIADIDGLRTEDVTVEGRAAVEVSFRPWKFGVLGAESFTIDKENAQVLRTETTNPSLMYRSTTTLLEVVDEIPVEARALFEAYAGKGRICADGTPADDEGAC